MYPEYGAVYNRLRSFAGRPVPAGQTADALANAGFFYIGESVGYIHRVKHPVYVISFLFPCS